MADIQTEPMSIFPCGKPVDCEPGMPLYQISDFDGFELYDPRRDRDPVENSGFSPYYSQITYIDSFIRPILREMNEDEIIATIENILKIFNSEWPEVVKQRFGNDAKPEEIIGPKVSDVLSVCDSRSRRKTPPTEFAVLAAILLERAFRLGRIHRYQLSASDAETVNAAAAILGNDIIDGQILIRGDEEHIAYKRRMPDLTSGFHCVMEAWGCVGYIIAGKAMAGAAMHAVRQRHACADDVKKKICEMVSRGHYGSSRQAAKYIWPKIFEEGKRVGWLRSKDNAERTIYEFILKNCPVG
jgi:hypothetical protein